MANSKELNDRKYFWQRFGKRFITPIYATGSGVITTVAVGGLSWIAGLALPLLIPLLLVIFAAETAVSAFLFKDSVPETLVAVFATRDIFKNLSRNKKILLGLGMFSALGGGLALGALTYTSGVAAIGATLAVVGAVCPPIGIALAVILGSVAFIAYSSLLVKWISSAIKNDAHKQVGEFFRKILTRDPEVPRAQHVLEGIFKLLFTVSIVAITAIGTIATLGTMQKGLGKFFSLIPNANALASKIAAGIISFGLMGVARLPWAIQSVCSVFSKIGGWVGRGIYRIGCAIGKTCLGYEPPTPKPEPVVTEPGESTLSTIAKVSAVLVHGFSFGALAKSGGGQVISDLITTTQLSTSTETAAQAGAVSSIVSGGLMAGGIGGFTLFTKPKEPSVPSTALDDQTNINVVDQVIAQHRMETESSDLATELKKSI